MVSPAIVITLAIILILLSEKTCVQNKSNLIITEDNFTKHMNITI